MKEIVVPVRVRGDRGERRLRLLFDTGATVSVIREDIARLIGTVARAPRPMAIELIDGTTGKPVRSQAIVHVNLRGQWFPVLAFVMKRMTEEMILGCSDMELWDIRPIPRNGSYIIPKPKVRIKLL